MTEPKSRIRRWLEWHSVWSHIAGPIWVRIPEKHRWRVVDWLNKSDRRCWGNLVDDALAVPEKDACDISVPGLRDDRGPSCAETCGWMHPQHTGTHECGCYCGKFRFTATSVTEPTP